jgi:hypothetical protein
MFLFIRMVLYAAFAGLAGIGVGSLDASGDFTVNVDDIATLLVGVVGYLVTFASSRWAKARGGAT